MEKNIVTPTATIIGALPDPEPEHIRKAASNGLTMINAVQCKAQLNPVSPRDKREVLSLPNLKWKVTPAQMSAKRCPSPEAHDFHRSLYLRHV